MLVINYVNLGSIINEKKEKDIKKFSGLYTCADYVKNIPKSNVYHNDVGYRMYIARMNNRARCDNKLSIIFYREKDTMLYLSDYAYVQFWDLDEFSECRMDYHIDKSKRLSWYR